MQHLATSYTQYTDEFVIMRQYKRKFKGRQTTERNNRCFVCLFVGMFVCLFFVNVATKICHSKLHKQTLTEDN